VICVAEVPLLKQLYWKYQDRGFNIVGVSLDEEKSAVEKFAAQKGVFWPEICDGKQDEGAIPKLYHVNGTPDLFVIDRAGAIAARIDSAKKLDALLTEVTATDPFPARVQRDSWQRPVKVMEELHIAPGSAVADVGAGGGYFTFRMAARVGAKGRVFAQDISQRALDGIRTQAETGKLSQIETIHGTQDDPRLHESSLDAILISDTFHEFTNPDAMVAAMAHALKPGGRIGVLDRSERLNLNPADYMERHRAAAPATRPPPLNDPSC
jgi:predicted methyltransferase